MYTICYIAFFVLSTAAAFKNDNGNQMHFTDTQKRYTLPLLLQLVHTQRKCKNRIQLLLYPAFLAESEGLFGVLPYSFASLRSLPRTFKQSTGLFSSAKPTVLVRIPCCLINKKIKGIANAIPFILGGE